MLPHQNRQRTSPPTGDKNKEFVKVWTRNSKETIKTDETSSFFFGLIALLILETR
jgi:hypothetical protein